MTECQLKDKFCYLKNKLSYPSKNRKIIFLYSSFLKKQEISFVARQKWCTVHVVPIKSIK